MGLGGESRTGLARKLPGLAGLALLVALVCWASIEAPREFGRTTPFWPANAVVLAVLLPLPRRRWAPWLVAGFLGNMTADLVTGDPLGMSVTLSLCNSIEIGLTGLLLRRVLGLRLDFARMRHLAWFALIAGLASPLISAALASWALGRLHGDDVAVSLATWAAADGLGALIFIPVLTILRRLPSQVRRTPVRAGGWLALAGLTAVTCAVFAGRQPLAFLVLPPVLLVVFQLEMLGAACAVAIVVVVAILFTTAGLGPIGAAQVSVVGRMLVAQLFLASLTLTSFPTAAVLAHRRRLQARVSAAARRAAEQYRRLAEAEELTGIGYWRIDLATRKLWWSNAMYHHFGVEPGSEPDLAAVLDRVHPDDREDAKAAMAAVTASGETLTRHSRAVRPDGEVRHLMGKMSSERGPDGAPAAIFGTIIDVTDLRRAQEEIAASEARYRQLADSATDIVFKVDRDDIIRYVSPSARRYGYEPDELIGRTGFSLVHPDDLPKAAAIVAELFSGGDADPATDRVYRVRAADGRYVWMEGNPAIVRDADGQPVAVISQMRDVTERREAEIAVKASEARYRLLADHMTDSVSHTDLDGKVLYISPAHKRITGHEAADATGRSLLGMIHPDDQAALVAAYQRLLDGDAATEPQKIQYRARHAEGHWVWIEGCPTLARDAEGRAVSFVDVSRDITERKALEQALQASEARYRLVTETSRDVVLKHDALGVITYISSACRLLGYEPEALVGRNCAELIHPDDAARARRRTIALFTDPAAPDDGELNEYRVLTADGGHVWMEGNPAILPDEGSGELLLVNSLRDITARKALEAELRDARDEAEAAAAVKGEFLANMSHELRTPLTSVLGFTRLALEQPELSEASRGYISKASNAGAALLSTVNDILDFSKLESGQMQIRPEPSDAARICAETLELFSESAAAKRVTLSLELGELPPSLALDPSRLRQILLNLLGNAVKFSDGGEVRLDAAWRAADERLVVSVTDQGPGIAKDQQSLLFRRFSQVDGSSTRKHGGTGLGLAICMGLVEAMDGTIGVESEPGAGSRFFFEFPAAPTALLQGGATDETPLFAPGTRVLVADDHAVNRELVRAVLAPLGAEVTEAANGREALAQAQTLPFDLILMDLRMPELDGLAAMTAIRHGDGPNCDAPILAFSAGADELGAARRREAGFDGDLSKPVMPADLIAAVSRFAGGWDAEEDLEAIDAA